MRLIAIKNLNQVTALVLNKTDIFLKLLLLIPQVQHLNTNTRQQVAVCNFKVSRQSNKQREGQEEDEFEFEFIYLKQGQYILMNIYM